MNSGVLLCRLARVTNRTHRWKYQPIITAFFPLLFCFLARVTTSLQTFCDSAITRCNDRSLSQTHLMIEDMRLACCPQSNLVGTWENQQSRFRFLRFTVNESCICRRSVLSKTDNCETAYTFRLQLCYQGSTGYAVCATIQNIRNNGTKCTLFR